MWESKYVNMFTCILGTIIDINFVINYIDMFLVFQCVLTYEVLKH